MPIDSTQSTTWSAPLRISHISSSTWQLIAWHLLSDNIFLQDQIYVIFSIWLHLLNNSFNLLNLKIVNLIISLWRKLRLTCQLVDILISWHKIKSKRLNTGVITLPAQILVLNMIVLTCELKIVVNTFVIVNIGSNKLWRWTWKKRSGQIRN